MKKSVKYSVAIPCYNSRKSIPELLERLVRQFEEMDETFEVICVDDASPDDVAEVILQFHKRDPRIKLVRMFRNYGQQNALLTGFRYVQGDYVITLDDDLQHLPEEIPRLIEALGDNDVVMGVAMEKQHAFYRNLGSRFMRMILRFVFKTPREFTPSAFRIMRRSVAERLLATRTIYPYLTGMILRITSKIARVQVKHAKRSYGRSNYSFRKLVSVASNLFINYSKIPLQLIITIGFITFILSLIAILYIVIHHEFISQFALGWPSLIVAVSFFGSLNLLAISMIGEYVIRLLNENAPDLLPIVRETYLGDSEAYEHSADDRKSRG